MSVQFQAFSDELIKISKAKVDRLSKLEKKLQPGDILMTTKGLKRPKRMLDRLQLHFGENLAHMGEKYHHAAIYAGDGNVVDMRITGLKERPLNSIGDASVKVYRPRLSEKDKLRAVQRMRKLKGKRYASGQVVKATASYLAGAVGNKKAPAEELICTGALAEAYKGKIDFGRRRDIVGPWDVHRAKKIQYVTESKGRF